MSNPMSSGDERSVLTLAIEPNEFFRDSIHNVEQLLNVLRDNDNLSNLWWQHSSLVGMNCSGSNEVKNKKLGGPIQQGRSSDLLNT